MAEAQIENSLKYWKSDNIIVVTNFAWGYKDVMAYEVGNEVYCDVLSRGDSLSNKPNVIINLIENGLVDEVNWIHDWDAFQIGPIELPSLEDKDIGLTTYGYKDRIQFGNVFFKPEAIDIFKLMQWAIKKYQADEEETMNILIRDNVNNIQDRIKIVNSTYNVSKRILNNINELDIEQPIKVAHFPPYDPKHLHKFSKILSPKLFKDLSDRFTK